MTLFNSGPSVRFFINVFSGAFSPVFHLFPINLRHQVKKLTFLALD